MLVIFFFQPHIPFSHSFNFVSVSVPSAVSGQAIYKQGFLHKQVCLIAVLIYVLITNSRAGSGCEELENSIFCTATRRPVLLQSANPPSIPNLIYTNPNCQPMPSHSSSYFLTFNHQSKDQALHGDVPLNTFYLKDATIEIVPYSKHNKSCVFEIQFNASSGNKDRTLVLEAESETDAREWVDSLSSHLDQDSDRSRCCMSCLCGI